MCLGKWLCILGLGLYGCGNNSQQQAVSRLDEAWNPANDPQLFAVSTRDFDSLAREATLPDARYPWSDDYWSTRRGGVAYRWQDPPEYNTGTYEDYRYSPHPKERFQSDSDEMKTLVDKLSPAEKYDLYLGRYTFPLVQAELQRQLWAIDHESGDVPGWFGLCHGWAVASLQEPEPGAVAKMTNAEGIEIPFYTSDINALMTKAYADNLSGDIRFLGRRCDTPGHAVRYDELGRVMIENCRDVNPGSFHLALVSMLAGPEPHSFVADMTRDAEVWNQPITGFKVLEAVKVPFDAANDPLASVRAPGTATLVKVTLDLKFAKETAPHKEPISIYKATYTWSQLLEYTLELDHEGQIIGGEWGSANHPDFLWETKGQPRENDLLSYNTVKAIAAASRLGPVL